MGEAIGEWVLHRLFVQLRRWLDQGLALPVISVHLSMRQFQSARLPERLDALLAEHRAPQSW